MNRWIVVPVVACCAWACGGELAESQEPEVPTMVVRSAVPGTRVAQLQPTSVSLHAGQRSDLCIDAMQGHVDVNFGRVQLWKCKGNPNQRWTLTEQPDGSLQILGASGQCVGGAASGAQLQLFPCADGAAGRYRFAGGRVTDAASGKCLTVMDFQNHGPVFLDTCSPANVGQAWTLAAVTAPTVAPVTAPSDEGVGASSRIGEATAWNQARVTGCELPVSLTGCDAVRLYLAKYPAGAHVDEANRALAAGQPQLEKLQKDENAWKQAGTVTCRTHAGTDPCVGVELYLTKYPAGLHADEAHALLTAAPVPQPAPPPQGL